MKNLLVVEIHQSFEDSSNDLGLALLDSLVVPDPWYLQFIADELLQSLA